MRCGSINFARWVTDPVRDRTDIAGSPRDSGFAVAGLERRSHAVSFDREFDQTI